MRFLFLIIFSSMCCSGSSQTEHTTFLKLETTELNQKLPELRFRRIIVVDNQPDSTPISIRGLNNKKYEKLRLDTPVSETLTALLSCELKDALHGSGVLTIVLNECRFYTSAGQIRVRGDKLRKVNSANLMKINLTMFGQGSDSSKSEPEYIGTLDRFFTIDKADDIPLVFQRACIGAILVSACKGTPASTIDIPGLRDSLICMDDDLGLVLQPKSFDSLTKGQSPFIQALAAYGSHTNDSILIFQCFQDLKRQICTTVDDSLVYDEELGLVEYLKTGRNRKLVENCWGVLYGRSFYVRFNQKYFFELKLDAKSATFRVPDYLSDMYTLRSMAYGHRVNLNRSLNRRGHAVATAPTIVGTTAMATVQTLTYAPRKKSSESTLLNSSSYSLKYRDCRIDPISGDIIYDFGSMPH